MDGALARKQNGGSLEDETRICFVLLRHFRDTTDETTHEEV